MCHDIHANSLEVYWPFSRTYQFDAEESLCWVQGDQLITSRWVEDPEYWEEVCFRSVETGELLDSMTGYCREMHDGTIWILD